MSAPLATLFHGDITIEQGCDTSLYGYGDLSVNRRALIGVNITTASTSPSTGSLVIFGGVGISENTHLGGTLSVSSTSNLQTTFISTNLGEFSVSGGNSVTISVGAAVSITSTNGNSSFISTNNNAIIKGGTNAYDAVQITATNPAGGVSLLSGQLGQLALTAGSGGIQGITSSGNISLTANNGSGQFIVNSSAGNQNLTLAQYGTTDSGVLISASGNNTTTTAIQITTTNTNGNISINNNGGLSQGSVSTLTGSSGYIVVTNTGGPIQMTAQAAASYIRVNTSGDNQNLVIGVNGVSDSSLILQSSGTNLNAILIQNTNTSGSILLSQPPSSSGRTAILTGSGGLTATTQIGGGINLLANGSSSSFINQTTASGQDLTICVQGTSASKLILCSQGTGNQSILLRATGSTGGIFATAAGPVSINSSDNVNGISIGTVTTGVPVNIGTLNSTTTVYGNLDVRGSTTTFESTVVTITDNILELNSAPSGIANAGVAVKRYQLANNTCLGAVVGDIPEISNIAQSGAIGEITLNVADIEPDNFYNGYWIKIISGTGTCQVRRIKTYNSLTKVATIYTTADQTGVLNNPTPAEGLDWITTPDSTSVYGLYPCHYIASIWDESLKEFALVCSNMVSGSTTIPIAHYIDLHVNNITANALTVNSINGTTADTQTVFNLVDNSTTPVILSTFPYNYGIYIVLIRPTIATSTRCYGIFVMGRLNGSGSCGQVIRLISVRGASQEQLDIGWAANSNPHVFYRPAPGVTGTTSYTIKVISV